MEVFKGTKIVNGIAIGKIKLYKPAVYEINEALVSDIAAEIERFEAARVKVQEDQNALYDKEMKAGHKDTAGIFEAHAMMLDDEDTLIDPCKEIMAEGHTAEYAVREAFDEAARQFSEMEDEYFRARSADVIDLKNSMLDVLFGAGHFKPSGDRACDPRCGRPSPLRNRKARQITSSRTRYTSRKLQQPHSNPRPKHELADTDSVP